MVNYNTIEYSDAFSGYEEATSNISFKHKRTPTAFPYYVYITQLPNPQKAVLLSGKITGSDGSIIDNAQIQIFDDTVSWYDGAYSDKYTGEYSVYVPYGKLVNIEIVGNIGNGTETLMETVGRYYAPSTRNFKVFKLS